jgi:AcrR family transcriptional regulator
MAWVERTVDQSPAMQRSRNRRIEQSNIIISAARRLLVVKGSAFTLQELAKEAEVALQTFYRYFSSKDQLLLALIEVMVSDACREFEEASRPLSDPVARLRFYITTTLDPDLLGENATSARFITAEHWRLHQLYPAELAQAIKPFSDLILREINAASEAGLLRPSQPESAAWLINQLVVSVYHHYAFAPDDESREGMGDSVWHFCFAALGGQFEPVEQADRRRWIPGRRSREGDGSPSVLGDGR